MSSLITGSNAQDFRARSSSLTRAPNPYIFNGITPPFYGEVYYFDPGQLPAVKAWWDPTSGITLTSGKLTSWVDRVFGNIATGSGATAPPFNTGAGTPNSFPGILTDASQNWAMTTSVNSITPNTCICVGRAAPLVGTNASACIGSDTGGGPEFRINDDGTMAMLKENVAGYPNATTNQGIRVSVYVWAADSANYFYRCNGTVVGSGSHGNGNAVSGNIRLLQNVFNTTEYWNGWLGDLIYCRVVLATADIEKAEGYLAWKYNLTSLLPSTHPYKNIPVVGSAEVQLPTWAPAYKRM
jgi:hypothetical protein